jgi:protein-S-isoprenylcysteine O-methyltransferase Ste14
MNPPKASAPGLGRVVFATVAFAAVHSLLASRTCKELAGRAVGTPLRDAWYRPLFNLQAAAATAWWLREVLRPPDRELWRAPAPLAAAMVAGQIASAIWIARAARVVGIGPLLGVPGARAWARGEPVPVPQEAQGPAARAESMDARGPFLRSRHPLNAGAIPILWLQPRMTRNRLVASVLATAYFVLGSRHEEHRLRREYGERYERYRRGGTRFIV